MDASRFVRKWQRASLKERSAAQEHFIDLCQLLNEPTPAEADPAGNWFAFEYGAKKAGGGDGWADVWRRNCFGWEYKGKGKDLEAAFRQLQLYAPALNYPPLLIVCDLESIVIHTAFTNAVQEVIVIPIEKIQEPEYLKILKWCFTDPEKLRPGKTRAQVTSEAASKFAKMADTFRDRGHDAHAVAHFLNRILFCLFAEDSDLLPNNLFARIMEESSKKPDRADALLGDLFSKMSVGGLYGVETIPWFNGGLFDDDNVLPMESSDIDTLLELALMDWQDIEPAIFGTLFERGLDPSKRSQLGAHYTDPETIRRIISPSIELPLMNQWADIKAQIIDRLERSEAVKTKASRTKLVKSAELLHQGFLEKLRNFRVLDPACGSGNFLYLALQALKNIEHEINLEAEALGLHRNFPAVGPENIKGIEINSFAAELARVTLWIGEIQWMLRHGYRPDENPLLKPLDTIEERDALIDSEGGEASWPEADCIIGNPPFLGNKRMIGELGEDYVNQVRGLYKKYVPGSADLVNYWFHKAAVQVENGDSNYVGLVATNSIRGGSNRKVLDQISKAFTITSAWSDEGWVNDGADVRVSLVNFSRFTLPSFPMLNGEKVSSIYSDLSSGGDEEGGPDLTQAVKLERNKGISFQGPVKVGPFDIPGDLAREFMEAPNPHGRSNDEVLRPWANGMDLTRRPSGKWIIDFGVDISEADASLYELPFKHVMENVKPLRERGRRESRKKYWWLHGETVPALRKAMSQLERYIATPRVAKHRVFVWLDSAVLPDSALVAVMKSDDVAFGVLHSKFHKLWTLRLCTWLGVGNDPRYTPSTTFETYPFPPGLEPDLDSSSYDNEFAEEIAEAARKLNELRENWLNPPGWVEAVPEVSPKFPDRILPLEKYESELKKRTMTNLYNQSPAWLLAAHQRLDNAVASAYGWSVDISEEEALKNLLELNSQILV